MRNGYRSNPLRKRCNTFGRWRFFFLLLPPPPPCTVISSHTLVILQMKGFGGRASFLHWRLEGEKAAAIQMRARKKTHLDWKRLKIKRVDWRERQGEGTGLSPNPYKRRSAYSYLYIYNLIPFVWFIYLAFFCELKIWNMSCMANCDVSLATHSCRVVQWLHAFFLPVGYYKLHIYVFVVGWNAAPTPQKKHNRTSHCSSWYCT